MRKTLPLFAALALVAVTARPGLTQSTFGAHVYGAFNTYQMGDVNDAIAVVNTSSGIGLNDISNGLGGGIDLRLWATPSVLLSAGWEPLFASTKDSGRELNVDANSFQAGAAYYFPSMSSAKYGVGAGVGFYSIDGKAHDPGLPDADIKGSGPGFHILGLGEWKVSPGFALTGGAGYRFAKVDIDDSATNAQADYSGFMGRVGLAFYMPGSGSEDMGSRRPRRY